MTSTDLATQRAGVQVALRRATRRTFLSRRSGRITVAQWPNPLLSVFLVSSLILRFAHLRGTGETALRVVAAVSLLAWALDEIVRGVNPFRKFLGGAVLLATVANLLAQGIWH